MDGALRLINEDKCMEGGAIFGQLLKKILDSDPSLASVVMGSAYKLAQKTGKAAADAASYAADKTKEAAQKAANFGKKFMPKWMTSDEL